MVWVPPPREDPGHSPQKIVREVFSSINVTTMYSIEFPVTVRIYYSVSIDRAVAQYYIYYKECSSSYVLHPMCSIKRWTNLVVRTMTLIFHTVFYRLVRQVFLVTGQSPNVICVYNVTTLKETISHFCDTLENVKFMEDESKCSVKFDCTQWNQRTKKNQQSNQLSVFVKFFIPWPYPTHTLRLVSPWGCPGNPAYPSGDMPLQPREATACSPGTLRGHPMARRLPLQSPQHTQCTLASGRAYPWYPAYTVFSKAPGAHTDYKTTRLQILPTTREHNKMPRGGKIQINSPEDGKYREKSPAEAIQRKT